MAAPNFEINCGLRDAALLIFLLCIGLREADLWQLDARYILNRGWQTAASRAGRQKSKITFSPLWSDRPLSLLCRCLLTQADIQEFHDRHLLDERLGNLLPDAVLRHLTEHWTARRV
jgi:hypothetical protein